MQDELQTPSPSRPRPWQPRFTIFGLMLTTLVIAVVASGVGYLVRAGTGNRGKLVFALIILAGPMLLIVAVSLLRTATLYFQQPRKRRKS
jgi:hypothetical protein